MIYDGDSAFGCAVTWSRQIPVTLVTLVNCRACSKPFCPVLASITNKVPVWCILHFCRDMRFIFSPIPPLNLICIAIFRLYQRLKHRNCVPMADWSASKQNCRRISSLFCWIKGTPNDATNFELFAGSRTKCISPHKLKFIVLRFWCVGQFCRWSVLPTPFTPTNH